MLGRDLPVIAHDEWQYAEDDQIVNQATGGGLPPDVSQVRGACPRVSVA